MKLAYSIKETAELLGCGLNRTYDMVHKNTLPHFRFGKKIMIPASAISDLVDQSIGQNDEQVHRISPAS
jgi:excisionase family DNA binding protein